MNLTSSDTNQATADELEVADSVISVRGTPQAAIPFAQLAMTAHMAPDLLPAGMRPGLEVASRYRPPTEFTWSNATHGCIVEVDPETGMVDIKRYVVSEDCGQMINPMVVEGQIAGGVAQGIGGVLFENLAYDDAGNPLATTFLDYLLPSAWRSPTSNTAMSNRCPRPSVVARAWARAARSRPRPRSPTRSTTHSPSAASPR